ncbi:response regulator, partial [Glaesserella parasuis]
LTLEPLAVDLVITDLDMPQMQGDALIAAMRTLRADLPVLLCSGQPRAATLAAALAARSLAKPYDLPALRRAVLHALGASERGSP